MPAVVTVKPGADPDIVQYGLSDGSVFFVRSSYAPDDPRWSKLGIGAAPDEALAAWLSAQDRILKAERLALRLVARAEQSRFGLERKLAQRELAAADYAPALDRLESLGLVDDARYAGRWVEARLRRHPESRRQLERGLRSRGLETETVRLAVAAAVDDERELDNLRRWLAAAGLDAAALSPRDRAGLAAAGFRPATLRSLLEN